MRLLLLILVLASVTGCNSKTKSKAEKKSGEPEIIVQVRPVQVSINQIPRSLKFRGEAYEAWKWTDRLGENLLVLSTVAPYADNDPAEREPAETAELHAFNFIKKDTVYKLLWKLGDAEKKCRFDLSTGFIKDAVTITDLDSNGIAETTIIYRLACRSDVSPSAMKLIMHQDTIKYALRGLMWLPPSREETFGIKEDSANMELMPKKDDEFDSYKQRIGRYEDEKGFIGAPPVFLSHARSQWVKFVKESMD